MVKSVLTGHVLVSPGLPVNPYSNPPVLLDWIHTPTLSGHFEINNDTDTVISMGDGCLIGSL